MLLLLLLLLLLVLLLRKLVILRSTKVCNPLASTCLIVQVNSASVLAPYRSFASMFTLFTLIRAACIVNAVLNPELLWLTVAIGALQVSG
jgi:hypothetical protein